MTGVKDGRKPNAGLKGSDDAMMYFVVDNVASFAKIDRVDDLIVAVVFVTVEILRLASVAWGRERMASQSDGGERAG